MKIDIRAKNFKLTPSLKNFIEEKIGKTEKFLKIFKKDYWNGFFGRGKPKAEAKMILEKITFHHRKGNIFRVQIELSLPNKVITLFLKKENIYSAINELKKLLQRELIQYKEEKIAKVKRGARKFKRKIKLAEGAQFKQGKRTREEGL